MIRRFFAALGASAVLAGCSSLDAHLSPYYTATPVGTSGGATPAPSSAPSSSSTSCSNGSTPSASVTILMSSQIAAGTSTPGAIAGYADNASAAVTGTIVAAPISVSVGSTVQFYNFDTATRSAAAIVGTSFPASESFASTLMFQTGTSIASTGQWSTGYVASGCVSQVLTVPAAGTYIFGDLTSYSSGLRGVIVAQ